MSKKKSICQMFLAVALLVLGSVSADAQQKQNVLKALGLSDGEVVNLNTQNHVPGTSFSNVVSIEGQQYTLNLQPHSIRSQNFRVTVQLADGSYVQRPLQATRLMKGSIQGMPGSRVVGSVTQSGLMALIVMPQGESFYIEPIASRIENANAGEHVVYRSTDVVDGNLTCGVINPANLRRGLVDNPFGRPGTRTHSELAVQNLDIAAGSIIQVAELAIDTDVEFFNFFGSEQATLDRIELVVGITNDQYESQVGLTHELGEIIIRSAEPDPYTSFDAFDALTEFVTYWETEQQDIQRDAAHFFTGKDLGGIGGVAFLSGMCTPGINYGLDRIDFNGVLVCSTDLLAHELGHNWSANHCSCPNNTMNSGLTCTNLFSAPSIQSITSFANSLDCLTDQTDVLLGDVNQDGVVNLLDVGPFIDLLNSNGFQLEADINEDGVVNLLDIAPFVMLLSG